MLQQIISRALVVVPLKKSSTILCIDNSTIDYKTSSDVLMKYFEQVYLLLFLNEVFSRAVLGTLQESSSAWSPTRTKYYLTQELYRP